jgi:Fe2+ or Zn2+ uptake regulation protein
MLFNQSKHVLFKCDECEAIVSVDFDDEDDIKKLNENKIILECQCGGESTILRN